MSRTWNCELCGTPHWDTENPIEVTIGDKEVSACETCLTAFEEVIRQLEQDKMQRERD